MKPRALYEKIAFLVRAAYSGASHTLLSRFDFQCRMENELLFFFKPECFGLASPEHSAAIMESVFQQFDMWHLEVDGAILFEGEYLRRMEIMDRHYGFINRLSKQASVLAGEEEREQLRRLLQIPAGTPFRVLGGHEFLQAYPDYTVPRLEALWQGKRSLKVRSGYYCADFTVAGERVVIVNGFHPQQLRHYTAPGRRILVLLLHGNEDWNALKWEMVGDTFPEKAKHGSIRSELYQFRENYGLPAVSIASNCVHLSAGPFEAMFEVANFFSGVAEIAFTPEKTRMFALLHAAGLDGAAARRAMENPRATIDGREIDLFTRTENMNSMQAVEEYRKFF